MNDLLELWDKFDANKDNTLYVSLPQPLFWFQADWINLWQGL